MFGVSPSIKLVGTHPRKPACERPPLTGVPRDATVACRTHHDEHSRSCEPTWLAERSGDNESTTARAAIDEWLAIARAGNESVAVVPDPTTAQRSVTTQMFTHRGKFHSDNHLHGKYDQDNDTDPARRTFASGNALSPKDLLHSRFAMASGRSNHVLRVHVGKLRPHHHPIGDSSRRYPGINERRWLQPGWNHWSTNHPDIAGR